MHDAHPDSQEPQAEPAQPDGQLQASPRSEVPPTTAPRRPRRELAPPSRPPRPRLADHPLTRRNYRVATTAIQAFADLVDTCVRLKIPGALVHARPRIGKTHAIDYVALRLDKHWSELLVLRLSCEHHRTEYEGPFFAALLAAAGVRDQDLTSNSKKRFALLCRLRELLSLRGGHIVVLLCDEAQRMSKHALEWLRDVHDQLERQGFRLITFLVGQPQLLERKAEYQLSGDEQIVARFMIEQLQFRGIADAKAAATCLASYDCSRYPDRTGPTFTEFFFPSAVQAGMRLEHSGALLWNAFVQAHAQAQLPGQVEVQMDYFTRAVESVLLSGPQCDSLGFQPDAGIWERAVNASGYVAAQQTVRAGR